MRKFGIFVLFTWIARIAVMLFIIFIIFGVIGACQGGDRPPAADKAQYGIQTYSTDGQMIPSRIYYANAITYTGKVPSVPDYWWYDGGKYYHVNKPRTFEEPTTIVKRQVDESG